MAGYLGSVPVPQATQHRETFTATAGQTTFNTAGYTPLFIDVYLNGVHLSPADITATNGSDVVLAECVVNDIVDIVSYTPFEVTSQTFTGTTTMTDVVAATLDISGNIDIDGTTNLDAVDIDGAVDMASTLQVDGVATFTATPIFSDDIDVRDNLILKSDAARITFGADSEVILTHLPDNGIQLNTNMKQSFRDSAIYIHSSADGQLDLVADSEIQLAATTVDLNGNLDVSGTALVTGVLTTTAATVFNGGFAANAESTVAKANGTSSIIGARYSGTYRKVGFNANNSTGNSFIAFNSNSVASSANQTYDISSEAARIDFSSGIHIDVAASGTAGNAITYVDVADFTTTGSVFNNDRGGVVDFRVASGSDNHALFVDASADHIMLRCSSTPDADTAGFMMTTDQLYLSSGSSTNANALVRFNNGNGLVGTISTASSATTYNTSSDYRLKENVNYTWDATTRLKQLKPAQFNWIADSSNTLLDGFLAHEVSDIVPNAVTGTKDATIQKNGDGYQSIDHSKLVPLLVKTIQELEARIATLEG